MYAVKAFHDDAVSDYALPDPTAIHGSSVSPSTRACYLIRESENKKPLNRLRLNGLSFDLGGETGIRTPDRLLTYTRFPGVRLKPLIHLSGGEPNYSKLRALRYTP